MIFSNNLNRVNKSLSQIVAMSFFGISSSIIAISISSGHTGVTLPSIVALASLFYLIYKNKLGKIFCATLTKCNSVILIENIIFIGAITSLILINWTYLYVRPICYFVFIYICFIIIILDIFSLNLRKPLCINIVLIKTIILCLIVYSNIYFEFPGIYGADPWWHSQWIKETIDQGHITVGAMIPNSYYLSPVYHLFISITSIITGLSIHSTVFISIGFPISLLSIMVYLFVRRFFDPRICLIASVLISLSSFTIERATMLIPVSLGFFYFSIIQILLLNKLATDLANRILITIVMFSLIFTHPIASIITFISLVVRYLGLVINGITYLTKYGTFSLSIILFSFVLMILNWMRTGPSNSSFFENMLSRLINSINTDAQFVLTSPATTSNMSEIEYFFSLIGNIGFLILLFFFIIELLSCIKCDSCKSEKSYLIYISSLLIAVPYSFIFLHLENILPDRWFIFSYLFLAISGASGLFKAASIFKKRRTILSLIIFTLILILIPLIISPIANNDSPVIYNNAVRVGYTQSEITAMHTLSKYGAGYPITDIHYGNIIPYIIGNNKYEKIINNNSIFILRDYYINHPEWNKNYKIQIHLGGEHANITKNIVNISSFVVDQRIIDNDLIYNNKAKAYSGVNPSEWTMS